MPNPETDITQSRIAVPGVSGGTTPGDFADVLNRLTALEGKTRAQAPIASGYYYGPETTLDRGTTYPIGLTANTLVASPFLNPIAATFNQVRINVTTAAASGGTIRMGVYSAGVDGLPSTLIQDLGTIDVTATGFRPSPPISLTLPAGLCWIAGAPNNSVSVQQFDTATPIIGIGSGGAYVSSVQASLTTGFSALPTTFPAPGASIFVPLFQLRAV